MHALREIIISKIVDLLHKQTGTCQVRDSLPFLPSFRTLRIWSLVLCRHHVGIRIP
jgi:hypothetical protein